MNLINEIKKLDPQWRVVEHALLRDYTSFQLGGSCPFLIEGVRAAQLPGLVETLNQAQQPFLVIGQGANLVVSDRGLDTAVIRFCSETPTFIAEGNRVTVSGDTLLDDLAVFTIQNAVGDLSFCTGIPGTVGGGITGNAGAFGRQMGDHFVSAELLGLDGVVRTVTRDELEFAYRHSKLKETGEIILFATFELPFAEVSVMQAERDRILQFRKEHHPDWHTEPCAGSVFRNVKPTSAAERRTAAGFFLQEAGAPQLRVGGARLYEKHANIIVADSGCTAQDVWDLSEKMVRAVQEKFDITLVREVRFLGHFNPTAH
ncbi:MAG: UDP-N-acetylmuramate dehydrogenase [Kiritimatiellaceae bacterium]|nr:UDP-N-acetylmuramate dehydrogenase [Kiritimatiellaceae bacterium]